LQKIINATAKPAAIARPPAVGVGTRCHRLSEGHTTRPEIGARRIRIAVSKAVTAKDVSSVQPIDIKTFRRKILRGRWSDVRMEESSLGARL
jgi:hypothetical protein